MLFVDVFVNAFAMCTRQQLYEGTLVAIESIQVEQ